jgi:hypothetical protein
MYEWVLHGSYKRQGESKMNRRDLLKGIVLFGAAPAIVRAESLMKLWVPKRADELWLEMAYQSPLPRDLWVGGWPDRLSFNSLQEAVNFANSGDRIFVSSMYASSETLILDKAISISGTGKQDFKITVEPQKRQGSARRDPC